VRQGFQAWILNYAKEARRLESIATTGAEKEYGETRRDDGMDRSQAAAHLQGSAAVDLSDPFCRLNEDSASGMSPARVAPGAVPLVRAGHGRRSHHDEQVLELLELHRVKFTCIDAFASTGVVGGVLSSTLSIT